MFFPFELNDNINGVSPTVSCFSVTALIASYATRLFTLVRFLTMMGFGYMAFQYYKQMKEVLTWTFVTLALLFQPFAKIGLGRTMWNIVDVIVAIGLVILFIIEWKSGKNATYNIIPNLPAEPVIQNSDNKIEFALEGRLSPKELIFVAYEE